MEQSTMKVVTIILLVLFLGAAGTMGYLWNQQKNENTKMQAVHQQKLDEHKSEISSKQVEIDALGKAKIEAEAQIAAKVKELEGLKKKQLAAAKGMLDAKDSEISKQKELVDAAKLKCDELESKIASVSKELDSKVKQLTKVENMISKAETEIATLKGIVSKWSISYKELEATAIKLKDKLLDNKIAVDVAKKFEGNILNILKIKNEDDALIIDLGSSDNIPVGQELKVVRDNTYLGKIEVTKLLDEDGNLSLAKVVTVIDSTKPIQVDDQVFSEIGIQ